MTTLPFSLGLLCGGAIMTVVFLIKICIALESIDRNLLSVIHAWKEKGR